MGKVPCENDDDHFDRCLRSLARLDHVVPFTAGRIGQEFGLAGEQIGKEAHIVGVVGDDEKVERTRQLRRLT